MSLALLKFLNGNNRGSFHRCLASLNTEPRIAWYPSAGEDFRDLLFLNGAYSVTNPVVNEPSPPDFFLHTDYFPWDSSQFCDSSIIHKDGRTTVSVQEIEELPRCDLPLDSGIVNFPEGGAATGRVIFMSLEVHSDTLGVYHRPVLYAFSENSAFCAQMALAHKACFSHVVHVRCGGGCGGGGHASGAWVIGVLKRLRCEVFVTDGNEQMQQGDCQVLQRFPELRPEQPLPEFVPIRTIPSRSWSDHGDVTWKVLRR
jgi:hypothetical protein